MQLHLAYTIPDAAKVSGVSRDRLYEAANTGVLKMKKLGRSTLILHQSLVDYLNNLPDYTPEAAKPKRK